MRDRQKPVTNSDALDEREPATGFAVLHLLNLQTRVALNYI